MEEYCEEIQIFINHISYDKEFVEALLPRYNEIIKILGGYIRRHSVRLWCKNNEELDELLDFIDGNGFIVERPKEGYIPVTNHPIKLIPIYDNEVNKENETKPPLSQLVPVQETALYYASVETGTRYILELPQFLPPRPLRLRIRGRMEFLRLVPESRRGSASVPRPP